MESKKESSYSREEEHAKQSTGTTGMAGGMGTGMTGMTGTGTTGPTTMGTTGTGEGMGQKVARKAGEAWEGVKEATPGTAEHKATHGTTGTGTTGTGTTTGGMTGATTTSTTRTNI